MMKRVCALLMALVLVLSASAALADEAADTLLVTVNGQEIRENDEGLKFWINYLYSQITDPAYSSLVPCDKCNPPNRPN